MANGDQALAVILDEVDSVLEQEHNLDFDACKVSPLVPKGMFLLLKLQKYQLKQSNRKVNFSVAGATGGVGAAILFLVQIVLDRLGWM